MTQIEQRAGISAVRRWLPVAIVAAASVLGAAVPAGAQARAARPGSAVQIDGYAMVGRFTLAASESFDAITGDHAGPILGGGVTVGLPLGGLFVDVGAWRWTGTGERVVVVSNEVIRLGIPVEVTIAPIEISAGWRFRIRRVPRLIPYVAAGYSSFGYQETSTFAATGEDVDQRHGGYHMRGGAEFKVRRWLGLAGEMTWATVADALGGGGVSRTFNEDNLGGTSFRARITVGR